MHAQNRDTLTWDYRDSTGFKDVTSIIFQWRTHKLLLGVPPTARVLVPSNFALGQNYPNPFNPTTTFSYSIARTVFTRIEVYNVLGQRVATLVSQQLNPGSYTALWNGKDDRGAQVSSGVYFVHMSANAADGAVAFNEVRKLVLMK